MDEIGKKLAWLIFILPGFLTVTIIAGIVDLGDAGEFSLTLYSLAFTFLNLVIALVLTSAGLMLARGLGLTIATAPSFTAVASVTLATAVVLGVVFGIALERGTLFAIVRQIPGVEVLNKRSTVRPLVFLLRRNTGGLLDLEGDGRPRGQKVGEAYLRIHLDDGPVFEGWPEFYSDKEAEIYLSPACTIDPASQPPSATKIPGPGVIVPESQVKYFVLIDRRASPCYAQWFADKPEAPAPP